MNYWAGAAALAGVCLSTLLLFATLSWLVNHQRTRLTSAWLVSMASLALLQSLEFLYHVTDWFVTFPALLKVADPLVVLLPLTLYGYIRALQGENILRPRIRMLLHLSPAIVVALLDFPYWSLPAAEKIEWMMLVRIDETAWQPLAPYGNDYLAIIALLGFIYWRKQRLQGYQGRKAKLGQWINRLQLLQIVAAGALAWRIALSAVFNINVSMVYFLALAFAWLVYQMLAQAQLPQDQLNKATATNNPVPNAPVDKKEPDSNDPIEENSLNLLFAELEKTMQDGAYTDNNMSLVKLAALCGMTTHQASAAINHCSGCNYYEWLNHYRIRAAQEALRNEHSSIADICFDVGFNSKSTFNTAFRKVTGCTPSQFRQRT